MKLAPTVLLLAATLCACKPAPPQNASGKTAPAQTNTAQAAAPQTTPEPAAGFTASSPDDPVNYATVEPIAPGQPGGLPDDRTPVSEGPFSPSSPQGAANVAQTYFARLGEKSYRHAWMLWADDGTASNMTALQFRSGFGRYLQYSAQVGAPGQPEGAAGSSTISVPVQIYGRLRSGEPFHQRGEVVLRRVNDVPGATPEQLLWRITRLDVKDVKGGG